MSGDSVWRRVARALLVLGLTMPACSVGSPTPLVEPTTITFACLDYQRGLYEDLAKAFERENPGIDVVLISADEAAGWEQQGSTVSSSGDEIARLAAVADTFVWFARLRPADWPYLLNLQPLAEDDEAFAAGDFYPVTLDRLRWQGELRGLPAELVPILIFYDKRMLDEAGVAYPQAGWSWDDLIEIAIQLTQREGDAVSRYGFVDSHFATTVQAMLVQAGVPMWDTEVEPPEPLFDRPDVARLVRTYTDLALVHGAMPVPEIGSNTVASALISEGKAAMWTDFVFDYSYHAQRTDVGLVPFPEDESPGSPAQLRAFFASARTAHPQAAWRWLAYLSAHYEPPADGFLPGRRSIGEQLPWWRRLDSEVQAALEYALDHPAPEDPLGQPLVTALADVFEGGATVEEALAHAQARALEMQAELAAVPSPETAPPPEPTLAGAATRITFAPDPSEDADVYRRLAEAFHALHPEIWVDIVPGKYGLAERAESADCSAGEFPVEDPAARELIRDLRPLLEAAPAGAGLDLDDYYPALLEPLTEGGGLWGLPYQADALMVFMDLERLAEAGVAAPEPGWTVDDFLAAAAALSDGERYGFATREGAYGDLLFALDRLGARLFDASEDGAVPTFDDPSTVEALARYAELSRGHPLTPQTPSAQSGWPDAAVWGNHPAGVETARVALWVDRIANHRDAPPLPFDVGVAPLPLPGGAGPGRTEFGVSAYTISARAADPQACWQWLAFLAGRPEVVQLLPARRSVASLPEWQDGLDEATLRAYQATLEYEDAPLFRLRWEQRWLGYSYPWLEAAFQAAVAGEDAGRALEEAQRSAQALVGCLRTAGSDGPEQLRACALEVDPAYPLTGE